MFHKIFVESSLAATPTAQKILRRFPKAQAVEIDRLEDYFGRAYKPYLQKRTALNLFLAHKRGLKVKAAPKAYGSADGEHFYFANAYNCIYECQYCYLQGYFSSPDIVLFLNYEEILKEAQGIIEQALGPVWFHGGEFSDSLALSHLTTELESYVRFFSRYPRARLELRTKSANTRPLLKLAPLPNVITAFSLSPAVPQDVERRVPPVSARIRAIGRLAREGYPTAVHFDPVIYNEDLTARYHGLLDSLSEVVDLMAVKYFSVGVVRFVGKAYGQVKKNYPDSTLFSSPFVRDGDGVVRYPTMMRKAILKQVKKLIVERGVDPKNIYFCMERP